MCTPRVFASREKCNGGNWKPEATILAHARVRYYACASVQYRRVPVWFARAAKGQQEAVDGGDDRVPTNDGRHHEPRINC